MRPSRNLRRMWTISVRRTFLHIEGDEANDAETTSDVASAQSPVLRSNSAPGGFPAGDQPSRELGAATGEPAPSPCRPDEPTISQRARGKIRAASFDSAAAAAAAGAAAGAAVV